MSLKHVKNMGGQNYREEVLLAAVSVTKDTVLYNVSGYASNASAGAVTQLTLIGVVQESVDNSGGSVGDKAAIIEMSPLALYEADTTGTPTQAQMWTDVTLDAVGTVDEDDPQTTGLTGVIRLRKLVGATDKIVLCSLNYGKNTLS